MEIFPYCFSSFSLFHCFKLQLSSPCDFQQLSEKLILSPPPKKNLIKNNNNKKPHTEIESGE